MNGGIVKRILGTWNPEEPRTLFEGFVAQTLHPRQFPPGPVRAMLCAVFHDIGGKSRAYAGDIAQEIRTCRIEIYTHTVDTALNRIVQSFLQEVLVHVMLVLPHPERLRVNLHQFGKGVHQTAAYRHCSPYGHILVREFCPRSLGSGIYGSPVFTY